MSGTSASSAPAPIEKRVTLKARNGERLSVEASLPDDGGRLSAAEYLQHLHELARRKMDEPALVIGTAVNPYDTEALKRIILYVAGFHDTMFGTFNRDTTLPAEERDRFVEFFLLAVATVLDGRDILVDLPAGRITTGAAPH